MYFFVDQNHEEAHEDENSDDSEEVCSSFSQEIKHNNEAVFQETKPRITRRHSYGKYGSEAR